MKRLMCLSAILFLAAMLITSVGCSSTGSQTPQMTWEAPEKIVLVADHATYDSITCDWKVYADRKDVTDEATYTVENTSIATFENGVATAVDGGKTILSISYQNETKAVPLYVLEEQEAYDFSNKASVRLFGRTYMEGSTLYIPNVASGFEVNFIGTSLTADLTTYASTHTGSVKVYVDGEFTQYINYPNNSKKTELCKGLEMGVHTVKVLKMTEQGWLQVKLSNLDTDGTALTAFPAADLRFEFYGDSITSGFGNLGDGTEFKECEDGTQTYATMLGEYFGADCDIISYAGAPACLPLDNSQIIMNQFFDKIDATSNKPYDFEANPVDLIVLNLGTNDSNSSKKNPYNMAEGYAALLRSIRAKRPDVPILCVYGMMGIDSDIDTGIANAVNDVMYEGESDIFYLVLFADNSGYKGHPTVENGHTVAFDRIRNFIQDTNLIVK